MTEKNRERAERKARREATGKLWNGYKPLATPTKREKEMRAKRKYKEREE
jgi:hypothetical protein